jgi:hypothetical protein
VVVMQGRLQAQGGLRELRQVEGQPIDVELREPNMGFAKALMTKGLSVSPPKSTTYRVQAPGTPEEVVKLVLAAAREAGAQVRGFSLAQRSLEEAFLEVVRK